MAKRPPNYIVYSVKQGTGDQATWREIGAGWRHKDGEGITLKLDLMPLDGTLVVRRQGLKPNPVGRAKVDALVAKTLPQCTVKT